MPKLLDDLQKSVKKAVENVDLTSLKEQRDKFQERAGELRQSVKETAQNIELPKLKKAEPELDVAKAEVEAPPVLQAQPKSVIKAEKVKKKKRIHNPRISLIIILVIYNLFFSLIGFAAFGAAGGFILFIVNNLAIFALWYVYSEKKRGLFKQQQLDEISSQTRQKELAKEAEIKNEALSGLYEADQEVYRKVIESQNTSSEILKKLEAYNPADNDEMIAQQKVNDAHFLTLVKAYKQVKLAPDKYEEAEQKLSEGLRAIEHYAERNQEALKQLNEEDMREFKIVLRMMEVG